MFHSIRYAQFRVHLPGKIAENRAGGRSLTGIDRVEKRLANFRLMTSGKHSRCFFHVIVCPTVALFTCYSFAKGILVLHTSWYL